MDDARDDTEQKTTDDGQKPSPRKKSGRWIGVTVGLAALVALGSIALARGDAAPEFGTLEGATSLQASLDAAQVGDLLTPITHGDGKIDILYVGAPECVYCQQFMTGAFSGYEATSFDDLVTAAGRHGLDFAYMPLAMGPTGVVAATLKECAERESHLDHAELVRATYDVHELLASATQAAAAMPQDRMATDGKAVIDSAVSTAYGQLGAAKSLDLACYEDRQEKVVEQMKRFIDEMGRHGTPAFFFDTGHGTVRHFSGAGGVAPMLDFFGQ